jgi:hypothetical protein
METIDNNLESQASQVASIPGQPEYDFLKAAGNHALASGDMTALEAVGAGVRTGTGIWAGATAGSAFGPVGTVIGAAIGGITGYDWKTTAATTVSAANQLYNSTVSIANFLPGVEMQEASAHDWMQSLDNDLAQYYTLHKEGIDTAGFIASSIPAGLGALKVYNYGAKALDTFAKTGKIGIGMSEATGLLTGKQDLLYKKALESMAGNSNVFSALNANFIKAAAVGAGEQAIQGLVFEAGVQTMLNASPILDEQDAGDIAHNLYTGAWVSGLVGGLGSAVVRGVGIAKELSVIDKKLMGAQWQDGISVGSKKFEELAVSFENQAKLDTTPIGDDAALNALKAQKQARTNNAIDDNRRQIWRELVAGEDDVATNQIHEVTNMLWLKNGQKMDAIAQHLNGLVGVARKGVITKAEKVVEEVKTAINAGKQIADDQYAVIDRYSSKLLNTWGERMGQLDSEPRLFNSLWDKLGNGQKVVLKDKAVIAGDSKYVINPNKVWDARTVTDVAEANARTLWAHKTGIMLKPTQILGEYDIPMLEKAYKEMRDAMLPSIRVISESGKEQVVTSADDMLKLLTDSKKVVIEKHLQEGTLSEDAISNIANVRQGAIRGTEVNTANPERDIFALQSYERDYQELHGISKLKGAGQDILMQPNQLKLVYDTEAILGDSANAIPFMANIRAQQKIYEQAADTAVASVLGESVFKQLIKVPTQMMREVTRAGAGGGMLKSADSNYLTAGSVFERIGTVFHRTLQETKNAVNASLHPVAYKLYGNQKATMDYVTVMHQIGNTGERYKLHPTEMKLVHESYDEVLAGTKALNGDVKLEIPIQTEEAYNLIRAHRDLNKVRLSKFEQIRALGNSGKIYDGDIIYAPPVNLKDYPYYAFVSDSHQLTGTGATKMIWATDPEKLEAKLALIPEEFQAGIVRKPAAVTGKEVDRWKKAIGDYERGDSLTDNYFDSALGRSGAASEYLPPTKDSLIVDHLMDWHYRQERNLLDETFGAFYSKEFDELQKLAERWSDKNLSRLGFQKPGELAKEQSNNPYLSYIRTALDMPNTDKIPMKLTQDWADKQVSKLWNEAKHSLGSAVKQDDLDAINKAFQDAGINTVNYDAVAYALANHEVPRGALGTFVRRANSIVAGIGLGLDALNAINNRVGSLVMLAPETQFLLDKIKAGNTDAVGALAQLGNVTIPGTQHSYLSTHKLIANALKDSFKPEMRAWAAERGFSTRHVNDVSDIVDTLALTGKEYQLDLEGKITLAFDKTQRFLKRGSELTGNAYAEEMTRLTAALVAKQITDIAVSQGIITERLAESAIQTFVNRTNGIYLASQRPMMFNGPIGQAVGLYQTYTITMMNNFFRYVSNGSAKSAALMMTAQGSIYGMSGLPAFQAINTHIVGGAAGNGDHTDMFAKAYASMDKDVADWFMYGALSNVGGLIHPGLKTNMYTRGDVNPRNITVVPLNPADIPAVSIGARFISNFVDTVDKIAGGGSVTTSLLQGLEHNGISRPLTGLAQVLEAFGPTGKSYATSRQGSLIAANDLMSMVNLTRLAGAKPMDEALALDASYRSTVYKAKHDDQMKALGSTIKSKVTGNQELTEDDLHSFQQEYIKLGGKQNGWNRYFARLQKDANVSVSNRISKLMKSQDSIHMQNMMGGIQLNDFTQPESEE